MDYLLKDLVKNNIFKLKMNNFQNFINELYLRLYGDEFLPSKIGADDGCDGILKKEIIFAIYGPDEKKTLAELKGKIKSDYKKYNEKWKDKYPKWLFIYNGEFSAKVYPVFDELGNGVDKIDINHLIEKIDSLNWGIKRDILINILKIPEEYITKNIFQEIIEDLLKNNQSGKTPKTNPPNLIEKIRLNFSKEDEDSMIKMYNESYPEVAEFGNLLNQRENEEIIALKNKVLEGYMRLSGDFKSRFNNLIKDIAEKNKNEEVYLNSVRIGLLYLFEICLIGKEVNKKDDISTARI